MAVRGSPAKGVGWGDWREGSNPSFSAKAEGPCKAWAFRFAFGWEGFEGRKRKCRGAAFSRPGEHGQEAAPRGAQADRRPCGESLLLRRVGASSVSLVPAFFISFPKAGARSRRCPAFPQKVPLGSPARLQARSRRLAVAANLLRRRAGKAHARHGPSALHMIKGIRRAEEGTPQCGVPPPRGARARGCAARSGCGGMPRRGVFPP